RAGRGDPEAQLLLDEAWALAEPPNELSRVGRVSVARAETFWLEGDHGAVLEATGIAFDLATQQRWPWFAGELACWRRRAGAREPAPEVMAKPTPCSSQVTGRTLSSSGRAWVAPTRRPWRWRTRTRPSLFAG